MDRCHEELRPGAEVEEKEKEKEKAEERRAGRVNERREGKGREMLNSAHWTVAFYALDRPLL